MRRSAQRWTAFAALLLAEAALAAGGAHVVDNAAVATPGTCHLEPLVSRSAPHAGLVATNPACTPGALPNLGLGAALLHAWDDGDRATTIGIALKLVLRGEDSGVGVSAARWATA